ncbi:MAG: tetratricopeptide repeat protein [Bacteroidia bacterium]|nr:tetratricopeptide repeat protein [Bacteroidia bacterium]MDW8347092.1 tetratricopeptide repeat protein [Bacteroidia bacterium]
MKKITAIYFIFIIFNNLLAQSLDEATSLWHSHKYNSASRLFKKIIENSPTNAEAYYRLGEMYLECEKLDSARIYFSTGTEKVPNGPWNYVGLAKVNAEGSNLAEARKNTDKALNLTANKDVNILNECAEVYIHHAAKDPKYALTLLEQSLKLDPKNIHTYILKGDAYRAMNDGTNALKAYDDAEMNDKNTPKKGHYHIHKGRLYKQGKSFDAAESAYLKAIELAPNNAASYKELGDLYYQARKYNKSKEYYDKYLSMAEPTMDFYKQYARLMYLMKDFQSLKKITSTASGIDNNVFLINRLAGYAAFELKEYDAGEKYLAQMFKVKKPNDTLLASDYEYYGKCLSKQKKDSLAIEAYKKALEIDPKKEEIHGDMAFSYFSMKKYKEAIVEYEYKIKNLKPNANDYIYLGRCYYFEKMYVKADTAYMKVMELAPSSPQGPLWRAYCNSMIEQELNKDIKDPKQKKWLAKPFYEQFISMPDASKDIYKKDNANAYSYLGYYYLQNDDNKKAVEMYQKALEFDPNNKEVKDAVEQLKKKG